MSLDETRNELSIKGKNGLGFLMSGVVIWFIVTVIFSLSIGIYEKNIFMLISTGLMFPLSIGMSRLIKAEWKFTGNALAPLGIYLNVAQIVYFPILFWAIGKSPEDAIIFFAIITCAHFFPYGWYYNTKAYTVMAVISALFIMIIGWNVGVEQLWIIPLITVILLLILITWLVIDVKRKSSAL